MDTLNIASKANQATTFPALLVASSVHQLDSKTKISVHFQDVDVIPSGGKEVIGITLSANEPIYGSEKVLVKLLDSYSVLQGKDNDLV